MIDYDKHALFVELEDEEGFRPSAYRDHLGYLTIGIGSLIDARKGGGISKNAAYFLAGEKVADIESVLDKHIPWWRTLTDVRQRVLISMAYQMGPRGLLGFKKTLKNIEFGNYVAAKDGMLESLWAKQTPERAKRLAARMESGKVEQRG